MIRIVRWVLLCVALAFIVCCRYMPALAEGYARTVYPVLSGGLSAFSSLFSFPLMEVFVVGLLLVLVLYPIHLRQKRLHLRQIIFREVEILAWIYVWFYLAWGLNYYRFNIYTRLQTPPVAYEEVHFTNFLNEYTEQLNAAYQPTTEMEDEELKEYVHAFYANLPSAYGLAKPQSWHTPKKFLFTPFYGPRGIVRGGRMPLPNQRR